MFANQEILVSSSAYLPRRQRYPGASRVDGCVPGTNSLTFLVIALLSRKAIPTTVRSASLNTLPKGKCLSSRAHHGSYERSFRHHHKADRLYHTIIKTRTGRKERSYEP